MSRLSPWLLLAALMPALPALSADTPRTDEITRRSAVIMPFDVKAATHFFTKTSEGGVQSVVVKRVADHRDVALVRSHLKDIRSQFLRRNFSAPARLHGPDMPGLAQLEHAELGTIEVRYRDIAGGAELTYATKSPQLVAALHDWFDAQLVDHGTAARAGHTPDAEMPH